MTIVEKKGLSSRGVQYQNIGKACERGLLRAEMESR